MAIDESRNNSIAAYFTTKITQISKKIILKSHSFNYDDNKYLGAFEIVGTFGIDDLIYQIKNVTGIKHVKILTNPDHNHIIKLSKDCINIYNQDIVNIHFKRKNLPFFIFFVFIYTLLLYYIF